MRGRTARVTFAHMPGACGLSPSHDGRFALTSGCDATIRVHDIRDTPEAWWRSEDTTEPELQELSIADLHDKAVGCLAIAPGSTTLATGSEDGFVRLFTLKASEGNDLVVDGELVQACARFGGPVRAVDFSPTGAFLAAAGDEPGVLKVIMTAQPSSVTILRAPRGGKGSEAAVALAFDPTGDFVAVVGEKGQAVVWDVGQCKLVAAVDLESRKAKCLAWSPDGALLVLGTDKGIIVTSRDTWRVSYMLEDANEEEDDEDGIYTVACGKDLVTALTWSANGRYLIAARDDSNISLWDTLEKKVLACWKAEEVAQRIYWHPKANALMLIDKIGQWGLVADVVPPHMPLPHSDANVVDLPSLPEVKSRRKSLDVDFGDDEEEVAKGKYSKKGKVKKKKQFSKLKAGRVDTKAKEDESIEGSQGGDEDENALENGFTFSTSDVEADEEEEVRRDDDDGDESVDDSASDEEVAGELADLENGGVKLPARKPKSRSLGRGRQRGRSMTVIHEPFVPTSTPLSEKAAKKRHILAWNLIGAVLSFDESSHDVIEIEFSDASRRTIGIKDHFGYTMGCLTERGVFLASPKAKEHGSLITFRPFSSWSTNSDWTQFLPADECATVIALGDQFAAVATAPNNLIRLFSLSGIQTSVFGVQGNIVSAAASCDKLVIVYAEPDSSALRCELLEINAFGEIQKVRFTGHVMLCPDSQLEWIGFANDTGELCSYDSKGWLWLMIDPHVSKRWIPVMQNAAKVGECDWFWVASATSTHVIGAPCLSNERYPPAKPRPALRTLQLSAPVIDKVTKSGKPTVVERFLRTKFKLNRAICAKADADELYDSDGEEVADAEDDVARMEVETDKCLLALMEDACRNEQNMRALDLASRLHSKVSFKYAVELSKHFKRNALATRVEQVATRKMSSIEQDGRNRILSRAEASGSPVTPVSRGELQQDKDDAVTAMATRKTISSGPILAKNRMQFDSDGEEARPRQCVTKNEKIPAFGVMDVTDDEEEEAVREPEPVVAEEFDEEDKMELVPDNETSTQKRKRPQATPASQASVKAGIAEIPSRISKKTKVLNSMATKGTVASKGKFRNRFLKR